LCAEWRQSAVRPNPDRGHAALLRLVAVDGDVNVVVGVGGVGAAVLHPAPALVGALHGPDVPGANDLADAELGVVGADPLGARVAQVAVVVDHDVEGLALGVVAGVGADAAIRRHVGKLRADGAVDGDGVGREALFDLRAGRAFGVGDAAAVVVAAGTAGVVTEIFGLFRRLGL